MMLKRQHFLIAATSAVMVAAAGWRFRAAIADGGHGASSIGAYSCRCPVGAARRVRASAASGPRLAARDPALEQWKRQAAERIHSANAPQLFEGRPHHLLQGVIVVDVTVDRSGKVTRSKIVRSPGIARA